MLYNFKVACCHIAMQLVYIHTVFCCCNTLQLEKLFATPLLFYQLNTHSDCYYIAPYGFRSVNKDTYNNCSCNASQLQTCICLKHIQLHIRTALAAACCCIALQLLQVKYSHNDCCCSTLWLLNSHTYIQQLRLQCFIAAHTNGIHNCNVLQF